MAKSGEQFLAIADTSVLMQFGYCISYLKYLSNLILKRFKAIEGVM